MNKQSNPYALTEQEKQDMIKRLTQDVDWSQDELIESSYNPENVSEEDEGLVF